MPHRLSTRPVDSTPYPGGALGPIPARDQRRHAGLREGAPDVPRWAAAFIDGRATAALEVGSTEVVRRRGARGAIFSVVISGAASMDARSLESRVVGAYSAIAAALGFSESGPSRAERLFPVRFWNFIPGIHAPVESANRPEDGGEGALTRYMVFNAGRFAALERWRSAASATGVALGPGIAAATGVGYRGEDLVIHCLALPRPGRPVENPRQVPAYRYSRKWGPVPPCFARATLLHGDGGRILLVGGTASVRGEASVHARGGADGLEGQVRETMANLSCLIAAGFGTADIAPPEPLNEGTARRALGLLGDVRVYYATAPDRARIAALIAGCFAPGAEVEFVRADICRPELLVEVEGVAAAPASGA